MKNYYELLSLEPSAPPDEIKRAFREEIARYHPDKVQHLGKEFQDMAAIRAAQLTEAYRTLMNVELRAEYDRMLQTITGEPSSAPPSSKPVVPPTRGAESGPAGPDFSHFSEERSTKDEFVRQATLMRIRQVLAAELANEVPVRGFDFASSTTKSGFFAKSKAKQVPNLLVRLVLQVNRAVIQETWNMAAKALGPEGRDACVLLLGTIKSPREASEAVAALPRPGSGPLLIPVDIRDWSAQIPRDAPKICRSILQKLRS